MSCQFARPGEGEGEGEGAGEGAGEGEGEGEGEGQRSRREVEAPHRRLVIDLGAAHILHREHAPTRLVRDDLRHV